MNGLPAQWVQATPASGLGEIRGCGAGAADARRVGQE